MAADESELRRVEIFDTLGYQPYENAEQLYRILAAPKEFAPLKATAAPNAGAPVYIFQLPFNIDAQTRIIARVKKARLRYRSFDPSEQSHDIRELRGQIERYLKFKNGLWILFDNLDKGWSAHGLAPEDLLIIRCLLDATRKLEQSLQPKGVECHTIVLLMTKFRPPDIADFCG